jgi:hypothetical protein
LSYQNVAVSFIIMKKLSFVILVCLALAGLYSCKTTTTETDYNPNVLSAKDYLRAEDAMFEIVDTYFKGILDTLVIEHCYGYIDNCEVCWYPADSLLTFGYGSVNRMCQDGKFRRGSFNVYFSGEKWDVGVKASLLTDQLYVDDSLVEASMVLTNNGLNADNIKEFALNVSYCKIRLQDSTKINPINISADFILEWAEGSSTPEIHEDDTYLVSGTASGTSSDGFVFSVEIQDTLVNHIDCYWISSGLSKIIVPEADFQTGTIDYLLNDGCFNEINLYFNDNKFYDILK